MIEYLFTVESLIKLGRIPRNTQGKVYVGKLDDFLKKNAHADLQIFGLADRVSLEFIHKAVEETKSTCIFVHDSGHESALV